MSKQHPGKLRKRHRPEATGPETSKKRARRQKSRTDHGNASAGPAVPGSRDAGSPATAGGPGARVGAAAGAAHPEGRDNPAPLRREPRWTRARHQHPLTRDAAAEPQRHPQVEYLLAELDCVARQTTRALERDDPGALAVAARRHLAALSALREVLQHHPGATATDEAASPLGEDLLSDPVIAAVAYGAGAADDGTAGGTLIGAPRYPGPAVLPRPALR